MSLDCLIAQKNQLSDMLALNEEDHHTFKALVYDERGRVIVSQLFPTAQSLMDFQVTLWLDLNRPRDRVPDVVAVYFVQPTIENVQQIARDAERQLYRTFYINFTSSIPRDVLEEFGRLTAEKEFGHIITKVYDQYVDFITLENTLYYFDMDFFYHNSKTLATEEDAQRLVGATVESLFSLLVTMNAMPVMCHSRQSEPLKMVCSELKKRVLASRQTLFTAYGPRRPLLLLLDRDIDLSIALHHGSTYQALTHDLIGIRNNQMNTTLPNNKKIEYYLDEDDSFWATNKGLSIPQVQENFERAVLDHKNRKNLLQTRSTNAAEETERLRGVVGQLGDVTKEKDIIDKHSDIFIDGLSEFLMQRQIAGFYSAEEDLINGETVEIQTLLDLMNGGSDEDKLRLLIIHFVCQGEGEAHEQLKDAVQTTSPGIGLEALDFIERALSFKRKTGKAPTTTNPGVFRFVNHLETVVKGAQQISQIWNQKAGVECEATNVLERLVQTNQDREYMYVDSQGSRNLPQSYSSVIVFMWGGGNYVEYQNLMDWKQSATHIDSLVYGATHMPRPNDFLHELAELGSPAGNFTSN